MFTNFFQTLIVIFSTVAFTLFTVFAGYAYITAWKMKLEKDFLDEKTRKEMSNSIFATHLFVIMAIIIWASFTFVK